MISKAKTKGISPKDFRTFDIDTPAGRTPIDQIIAGIYEAYEAKLRANNSLDFDDLLIYGVQLFKTHPPSIAWCKHVLVDEL